MNKVFNGQIFVKNNKIWRTSTKITSVKFLIIHSNRADLMSYFKFLDGILLYCDNYWRIKSEQHCFDA